MARLKNINQIPPGGWFYEQHGTGFASRKGTLAALITAVADHRKANGLERTLYQEVKADIEAQICERLKGTRALWRFCDGLKTSEPPYTAQVYAQLPVRGLKPQPQPVSRATRQTAPVPAAKMAEQPAKTKSCPTCRKRKS